MLGSTLLGAVVTAAVAISMSGKLVADTNWRDQMSCGVNSCYFLLKYNGFSVKYSHLAKDIGVTERGSELSEMSKACSAFGAVTRVVKSKPSQLGEIDFPFIAHARHSSGSGDIGHYMVVLGEKPGGYKVFDPSSSVNGVVEIPRDQFFESWSGYILVVRAGQSNFTQIFSAILFSALLLFCVVGKRNSTLCIALLACVTCAGCGKSENHPPSIEILALSSKSWKGVVEPDTHVTSEFSIENVSSKELTFRLGPVSCSCSDAALEELVVPPGKATTLKMTIRNSGDNPGRGVAKVPLICDEKNWSKLYRVGYVFPGVRFPREQIVFSSAESTFGFAVRRLSRKQCQGDIIAKVSMRNGGDTVSSNSCKIVSEEFRDGYWSSIVAVEIPNFEKELLVSTSDMVGVLDVELSWLDFSGAGSVAFIIQH